MKARIVPQIRARMEARRTYPKIGGNCHAAGHQTAGDNAAGAGMAHARPNLLRDGLCC
jgi:hypothetical protein